MTDDLTLLTGDCIDILKTLPYNSVDACVTDPPYGIGFMGQQWDQPGEYGSKRRNGKPGVHNRVANYDHRQTRAREGAMEAGLYDLSPSAMRTFQSWCETWAVECLRVLKPGGHMLAFGGTRTWHRLACAVEDAGFEIRDSIAWLYGSGFPKSLDVSKAIDKAAGAEREVVDTIPDRWAGKGNVLQRSQQAEAESVNITAPATDAAKQWQGWGTALKPAFEPIVVARKPLQGTVAANVLAYGTGALNVDGCRVGTAGATKRSHQAEYPRNADGTEDRSRHWARTGHEIAEVDAGRWPANVLLDGSQADALDRESASRFFPTFRYTAKAARAERPSTDGVAHPTVKPVELMAWLIRLVAPPGGVVLDPFAGSGTTLEAALREGKRAIGIERDPSYIALIHDRLSRTQHGFDFGGVE